MESEYIPRNRDRNREADRCRMKKSGYGLLAIDVTARPVRVGRKTRKAAGLKVKKG